MSAFDKIMCVPDWPRWARRLFILTLPISGPIWALAMMTHILGWVVFILLTVIIVAPVMQAARLVFGAFEFLCDEWTRP